MSELDKLRELRQSISTAREACAGSNVQKKFIFINLLDKAVKCSVDNEFVNLPIELTMIEKEAFKIKDYGDRLPLDDKLCNILNNLDKRIRELEYNG